MHASGLMSVIVAVVDTIHRTHLDAGGVLDCAARLNNHIRQTNLWFVQEHKLSWGQTTGMGCGEADLSDAPKPHPKRARLSYPPRHAQAVGNRDQLAGFVDEDRNRHAQQPDDSCWNHDRQHQQREHDVLYADALAALR
jgi:hypothetical protein